LLSKYSQKLSPYTRVYTVVEYPSSAVQCYQMYITHMATDYPTSGVPSYQMYITHMTTDAD